VGLNTGFSRCLRRRQLVTGVLFSVADRARCGILSTSHA
jgi:hypothetical protein